MTERDSIPGHGSTSHTSQSTANTEPRVDRTAHTPVPSSTGGGTNGGDLLAIERLALGSENRATYPVSASLLSSANSLGDNRNLHTPLSSASMNPFRRSPSVSPPLSATTASARDISFQNEDPFSISATSAGQNLNSHPSHAVASSQSWEQNPSSTTGLDSPPELPPPPAYVQIEEPFSAEPVNTSFPVSPAFPTSPEITAATVETSLSTSATSAPPSERAQPRSTPVRESEPVNEYVLKPIDWIEPSTGVEKRIKIITQNENGPCPLLALCNTLVLQGKVAITPYDRPTIGYDHLLELLADYLLNEDPSEPNASSSSSRESRTGRRIESERIKSRLEIESALRLLPHLEHGLDVNVFFKTIRGFEPTAELGLFHTFGVELVHGWVVSPVSDAAMYALVDGPAGITSYNKAVECIVSGDDAGGGLVVEDSRGNITFTSSSNYASESSNVSAQDAQLQNEKIAQALVVQEFMTATKTQLTRYGLHFCTLFKNPMDGTLYTLVTDQSLAHEQAIVWESLVDVDGAGEFLDGLFRHGALEVGDYARNNQPLDAQHSAHGDGGGDEDFALALQLQQQEEEEEARRIERSKSRASDSRNGGVGHNEGGGSSSGGGVFSSSQQQTYETDEQMAARLHQAYLLDSQQRQQQQQQQQQQPPAAHNVNVGNRPYPAPGAPHSTYEPHYPGSGPVQQQQQWASPAAPQAQRTSTYQQPFSAAPLRPHLQGQVQRPSGYHSKGNSSDASSRKDIEKCIIS
ncbi:hypothetical protein BGZ54_009422 [Gamsiella multidivaricata]|nr:hypothetical protein BGZ54_009422 [Gamsiella multidivaricata]